MSESEHRATGIIALAALALMAAMAAIATRAVTTAHWDTATAAITAACMFGWSGTGIGRAWMKAPAKETQR